jgi:hypothetical protein
MQVYALADGRRRTVPQISIVQAFKAQGVNLKYPARSRSGIRWDDGAVVIAIEESDVHASADGFCCRLWAPISETRKAPVDWPSMKERLEHCRLAARHGGADGLLIHKGALVEADFVLTLHVARRGPEYWASWGTSARARRGTLLPSPDLHSGYRAAAG